MTAPPLGKDLVGLEDLSADQIRLILDTAEPCKEAAERPMKKVPALRGKTSVNLFFEASTRTRISFEEQIDDGLAAERRDFLDGPLGDFLEGLGGIEDEPDLVCREVFEPDQVLAEGERRHVGAP